MTKRLTQENVNNFFQKLTRGDLFLYSERFQLEDVYKLAYKNGWLINYFPPGTEEYKEHGCFTCKAMYRV